jgi:lipoprotein-releasing system permease protein
VRSEGGNTPFGGPRRYRSYPVNVIFNLGMVEFDSFYIFMPLEPAQNFFKMDEAR